MPAALFSAAFALGVIISFFLPAHGGAGWWFAAAALSAAGGTVFRYGKSSLKTKQTVFQAAFCMALATAGAGYGIVRTEHALRQQWPIRLQTQPTALELTVTGLPERDENGRSRFTADAHTADGRRFRLLFQDFYGREWQVGERWRLNARVRTPLGTRNAAGFDREAWALANGIDGLASAGKERFRLPETAWPSVRPNRYRALISAAWQRAAAQYPQGAGLMKALAVGDDSGLSRQTWTAFRPLGIQHLISISGLHIGMVALLAGWSAKQLMRLLPRLPERPRLWQLGAGVAAAGIYTALAGFEIPALRSLIMLAVFAAAWAQRGSAGSWQVWWTALAAVLLYQPAAVLSPGFWLSFGLVGALMWALAFRLSDRPAGRLAGWKSSLKNALAAQWSATLLGALATVSLFGLLPPFSPLVNAAAIPFFSWLLVPLALAASMLPFDAARTAAARLGEHTVDVLLWLGFRLPEIPFPHPPAPLLWLAVAGALLLLLPRGAALKPLALAALAAFALYRPPPVPSGSLDMTVFDVGQGLSVLLQTPSQTVLFDSGTPAAEAALLPNLRALGITRLDALILSHHDNDHDGGYPALSRAVSVGTLWAGQPKFYPAARHCTGGRHWQADGIVFEFLTLPAEAANDNEASCVLRIVNGSQAVLLTGDLGKRGETALVGHYGGSLYSQLLILGHHGSNGSSSNRFLNTVSPHTAVASSGFANPFRHPHPEVVNALNANRIRLRRTDSEGALHCRITHDTIRTTRPADTRRRWWQRKPFDIPQKP